MARTGHPARRAPMAKRVSADRPGSAETAAPAGPVSSNPAQVRLIGVPVLLRPGLADHPLERKDAALLAMLVLDGPRTAADAALRLWPDSPESQARANLRQRLFRLRKVAGSEVIRSDGVLRLAAGVVIDLAAEPVADAADAHPAIADLLAGLVYDDLDGLAAWVDAARTRWRFARRNAWAFVADRLETDGRHGEALRLAERLVVDDELQENGHRRLMRLLYLRGDRAAGLAAFDRCRATLAQRLGVEPDKETTALAALINSGRLASRAEPPTPVAVSRPPRLIGREVEWESLFRAGEQGQAVLVEGEAGMGKSRLLGDFAMAFGGVPVFEARPGDGQLPYAVLARVIAGLDARSAPCRPTGHARNWRASSPASAWRRRRASTCCVCARRSNTAWMRGTTLGCACSCWTTCTSPTMPPWRCCRRSSPALRNGR
jgi:DNA-binding SARP family transcriptional activator